MTTTTLSSEHRRYYAIAQKMCMLLGRKYGVEIEFGHHPSTDGKKVYLPHWNFEDPKMLSALYGVIAHEAGGHVAQTDFHLLASWMAGYNGQPQQKLLKTLENICEDIRIEANLFRKFPGLRYDMDNVLRVLFVEKTATFDPNDYWNSVKAWLLLHFRSKFLGQNLLLPLAEESEENLKHLVSCNVMQSADEIGAKIALLGPDKAEFATVIAYAEELYALFDDARPSQQPDPEEQESDQQEGEEDSSGNSSPAEDSEGGAQNDPSSEEGEEDSSGDSSSGENSEDGAQSDPSSTDDSSASSSSPDSPAEDNGEGSGSSSSSSDGSDQSDGKPTSSQPRQINEDLPTQEEDTFADMMKEATSENPPPYRVSSSDGAGGSSLSQQGRRMNVCDHMANAAGLKMRIVQALSPLICGDTFMDVPTRRGRNLSDRRLVNAKTDVSPRVFNRRIIEDDQSVAFTILVDRSSSTDRHGIYDEITTSSLGLALALETFPQVDCSIAHFPSGESCGPSDLKGHFLTKGFDVPAQKIADDWPLPAGCTPLADAYKSTALSFLVSEKERRILLVVTDGKPDDVSECRRTLDFTRQMGVEVYGVVIGSGSYPLDLFSDSEVIATASDLPAAVQRLVPRIL